MIHSGFFENVSALEYFWVLRWTVITIHWAEALFLLFKLNLSWPIQPSLSLTKPKSNAVLIKLLYPITSLGSCALVYLHVNPCTNSNKAKCEIQDYFANRQIKEDIKYNKYIYYYYFFLLKTIPYENSNRKIRKLN
jgi:hypothetical protein